MDYGLPRADTLPAFRTEIVEVLSPTNPFGIKAGGEGGTTPAPAAVINAIVDALAEFGVRDAPARLVRLQQTPYPVPALELVSSIQILKRKFPTHEWHALQTGDDCEGKHKHKAFCCSRVGRRSYRPFGSAHGLSRRTRRSDLERH